MFLSRGIRCEKLSYMLRRGLRGIPSRRILKYFEEVCCRQSKVEWRMLCVDTV